MHKLIRLKLLSAWHTSAWKVTTSLSFCLASMKLKGIWLACGESFPNNNNSNNKKSKNNIFFAIDHLPRNDVDTFHTLINTVRLCGQFFFIPVGLRQDQKIVTKHIFMQIIVFVLKQFLSSTFSFEICFSSIKEWHLSIQTVRGGNNTWAAFLHTSTLSSGISSTRNRGANLQIGTITISSASEGKCLSSHFTNEMFTGWAE